jgi:hypothetical protein
VQRGDGLRGSKPLASVLHSAATMVAKKKSSTRKSGKSTQRTVKTPKSSAPRMSGVKKAKRIAKKIVKKIAKK